jgi:hypothetical protein
MGFKNKEDSKAYLTNYYQENKEELSKNNLENYNNKYKNNPDFIQKRKEYTKIFNETHKEYNRKRAEKYRNEHKDEINTRRRARNAKFGNKQVEYSKKLKLKVMTHYCNGIPYCMCPKCDETIFEFLSIDHMNGHGTEHRKEIGNYGMAIYRWLKKNGFPDGYQVLCMNCNWSRSHNKGICPHEKYKS